ncbi:MAG: ctaD2 [Solirubrobacterales bacterium]|jgi:hypothetical protein|nr:ctaD2 [Solirubrobacterales bacterium]
MLFPFIGMAAEAASVFSGRRFFGYRAFVPAPLGFTVLSLSAWAHHIYTTGAVPVEVFTLTSTALIVPLGAGLRGGDFARRDAGAYLDDRFGLATGYLATRRSDASWRCSACVEAPEDEECLRGAVRAIQGRMPRWSAPPR